MALHVVDIRHEPTEEDRIMRGWLDARGLPTLTVLTKSDKLPRNAVQERVRSIRTELGLTDADPVVVFSAETRTGVDEIRAAIEKGALLSSF